METEDLAKLAPCPVCGGSSPCGKHFVAAFKPPQYLKGIVITAAPIEIVPGAALPPILTELLKSLAGQLTGSCSCPTSQRTTDPWLGDRPLLRNEPLVPKEAKRHNRYAVHRKCKKRIKVDDWLEYVYCSRCRMLLDETDLRWRKQIPKKQLAHNKKMTARRFKRLTRKKKERE
jgi:hypothetical protein